MAEKKKNDLPTPSTDLYKMAPEEYLDRYGVTTYLKDVVTLLLENRPEDPVEFVADYFKNVVNGTSPLVRSYRYIKLTPRNRVAFYDNLVAAYQSLNPSSMNKGNITAREKVELTGSEFKELVKLVCGDFPEPILNNILNAFGKTETSDVSFQEFVSAVNTCLLYEDFINEAQKLFKEMDKDGIGMVDKHDFCQSMVVAVENTIRLHGHATPLPSLTELQKAISTVQALPAPNKMEHIKMITYSDFLLSLFHLTTNAV